uniref:AMP-binding enzyme C-terminal domain-containing protein n=1 Tax=Coccidioides posadasii RMSCC 3488 TaxID=454284 RepID=A0A0J6FC24_COCPO|nr:hypothetical protein CPAG_03153 [Coccidioides posadasii RMSCC 3488]
MKRRSFEPHFDIIISPELSHVCLGMGESKSDRSSSVPAAQFLLQVFHHLENSRIKFPVNGLQVAPAELEAIILEHDDVEDGGVVGIMLPVEFRNEEEYPRAYVHLKPGAQRKIAPADIQAFIKARVAKHKQLMGGVTFIEAVPRLPSGKIIRRLLREWAKKDAEGFSNQPKQCYISGECTDAGGWSTSR